MYKTSVYTLVNGNIEELAHRKQQKSQKVILFSSTLTHSMGVGTGGAEGAAAPPTFGTGEQAIALAPPKSNNCKQRVTVINC